jgi:AraC family transcriptional regulator
LESDQQYAQRQVRQFKTDALSQIVASGLGGAKLLVSRVQRETPDHGFATPTRPDSVFSVLVQLRKQERRELYLDDRLVHKGSFPERTVSVVNHWQSPRANLLSAFDTVIFTVPQAALDGVAYEQGAKPVASLTCQNEGRFDPTIWSLAQSLLPALDRPEEVGSMYAERVLLASATYFAQVFGGMRQASASRHLLSRRQTNRAFDMMQDQMDVDLALSALASEMDLSARQFAQAFRRTTGTAPDRWLRHQRIEHAKVMLRTTSIPISQIATACGFVSPDHLSRVFASIVGIDPKGWRERSSH